MKLTKDNIAFVKVHLFNGVAYEYFVGMKSNKVSDSRCYGCFENAYLFDKLPKTIRKFLSKAKTWNRIDNGDGFVVVTFR